MSSPRFEPLFLAGSGVSGDEAAAASPELPEPLVSPTSTLQAAAAASPTSPAATCRGSTMAAPLSRDLSSGGGRRSRSHRRPWEARAPVGLGLAGALNGEGPVAAATTTVLLTGQRRLRHVHHTTNAPSCPRRCPSPREMVEASEDYTRVIACGPNPRTTHISDVRVVVDEDSCGLSLPAAREGSGEEDGFLRWCHGCSKDLGEGKDIFMYRGEMAFCSHECRYREMLLHEKL